MTKRPESVGSAREARIGSRRKESVSPFYSLHALGLPAVIWFPQVELRAIAAGAMAWGGVALWRELTRCHLDGQVLESSMALAGYSHVTTTLGGQIASTNEYFTEMTGYSEDEVRGSKADMLMAPRYDAEFIDGFWALLYKQSSWEGELWCRCKDGQEFPARVCVSLIRDSAGEARGYLFVGSDLGEDKRREHELWHSDRHDVLTGLPNRQRVHDLLEYHLPRFYASPNRRARLDMAIVDIDGFQMVNNGLGVEAGDRLLKALAARLRQSAQIDLLGRLGGDEFLVATQSWRESHDGWVACIRGIFTSPFTVYGQEVSLSVSMGTCQAPADGERTDNGSLLLQRMEMALDRAKLSGGNTDRRYSSYLDAINPDSLQLVQLLRQAIHHRNGLTLHYQTQHNSQDGALVGIEALLRWEQKDRGMISPADFIPLAERHGMMEDLGRWVINEAARQIRAWRDQGIEVPTVWVNVSAIQIYQGGLEAALDAAMNEHGIEPAAIGLEMTESLLLDDRAGCIVERLQAFQDRGFLLAIDDFGTGHSSLGYLREFPLNKVKLDRIFIASLPDDMTNAAIVRSVLEIASGLGLDVVAEGVETEMQLAYLRQQGCDAIQGFYFSRPVPAQRLFCLKAEEK